VYDFIGFIPGSNTQPAGWLFSTSFGGPTPDSTNAPDDPGIINLVWTRDLAAPTMVGPANLGMFSVLSAFSSQGIGAFAAETTNDGGILENTNFSTTRPLAVPIPEPTTALLVLAGPLFVLGAVRRGLRRRNVPAAEKA
jgi:hypothetical protein